jgi:hypothetical protein
MLTKEATELILRNAYPVTGSLTTEEKAFNEDMKIEGAVWLSMLIKINSAERGGLKANVWHDRVARVVGHAPSPLIDLPSSEVETLANNLTAPCRGTAWPHAELGAVLKHALSWTACLLSLIQVGGTKVDTLVQAEFLGHLLFIWTETGDESKVLTFYRSFREQLAHGVTVLMSSNTKLTKPAAIIDLLRSGNEVLSNRLRATNSNDVKKVNTDVSDRKRKAHTSGHKSGGACRYSSLSECWWAQHGGGCSRFHISDELAQGVPLPNQTEPPKRIFPLKTVQDKTQLSQKGPLASGAKKDASEKDGQ